MAALRPRSVIPGLILSAAFLLIVIVISPEAASPEAVPTGIVRVRVKADSSLNSIIRREGFALEDRDVSEFLREFMVLNEGVRSISRIKKGTVLRLPLAKLQRRGRYVRPRHRGPDPEKTVAAELNMGKAPEMPAALPQIPRAELADFKKSAIFGNYIVLLEELYGRVSMENDGLKFFSVGERSEISLDTSFFPMIVMDQRVVVVDTGVLPDEVKQIINVVWPEYIFVTYREGYDLLKALESLLVALGYSVSHNAVLVAGGESKVEYYADFAIVRKDSDLFEGDITGISIIRQHDPEIPDGLTRWLRERDIRIIQLRSSDAVRQARAEVIDDRGLREDTRLFLETMATRLGYVVTRDASLKLSDRREFSYTLHADLAIDSGGRKKVVEFAELSAPEIQYARRRGVDISCMDPGEESGSALRKLVSLLGVPQFSKPATHAAYITPRHAKYRLYLPGVFLKTLNGSFFITDTSLEPGLLSEIIDPAIRVITY